MEIIIVKDEDHIPDDLGEGVRLIENAIRSRCRASKSGSRNNISKSMVPPAG